MLFSGGSAHFMSIESTPGIEKLESEYRDGMSGVFRWKGGITEPTKDESNLDHMDSMLGLVEELLESYPGLMKGMDIDAIKDMILVHDAGELLVGDLVRSDPYYEDKKIRHKRRERAAFRLLTAKHVDDPQLKEKLRASYNRYTFYKNDDPEALFTHLIDKIQAVRYGLSYVYNNRVVPFDDSLKHAAFSIDLMFEFFDPLRRVLESDAKTQLFAFMQIETGRYITAGYPELHREARHKLFGESPQISTLPI